MELAVPMKSYGDLLDAQKDLFENQIEKLQQIVATQCKLTGVNPLSQEMAAGALSIKIGKRPRDLLNPKAVKYMQSLFSTKDAISKRETREISAQFGVTVTQVRDFFNGQRSRVRKFAKLSKEKVIRSSASDGTHADIVSTLDPNMPVEPVPLNTMVPAIVNEVPSCSKSNEALCDMEESDRQFIENIFISMRKEESFSGQLKLLKWILRVENPSVLNWFLTEGGLMILATWLSEAANEEQTSFLRVVLRVFQNLPMIKALPVHMSAVLQSVNSLRCYRTSDISHRARILLSKWSNMFGKKLSLKRNNGLKSSSDLEDEMLLKQSIHQVMGDESWDLKDRNTENTLRFLGDNPDNHRKSDAVPPMKLLMAPEDESNKRRGVLSSNMKERRKVQMVEHPGQRSTARGPQVMRSTSTTQSRPLSADDIQKAKMRAQYMQSKQGKTVIRPDEKVAPESQNRCTSSNASLPPPVPKLVARIELKEDRRADNDVPKPAKPSEISPDMKEPPWKKFKRVQIPWRTPTELKIMDEWCVADGASSKEVEVQKNRIRREREIIYRSTQEIPSNPKEPWDREMDPDDSLTPEIPIEQSPDVEPLETPPISHNGEIETMGSVASTSSSENIPVPDLELLAELLKNPQLVFALTSGGQAGNLSNDMTVKLLDMIKANGANSLSKLAGNNGDSKVEVSLPSPTPSCEPVPNGSRPDFSRNPFSRQQTSASGSIYQTTGFAQPVSLSQHSAHLTASQTSVQLPLTTQMYHQQSRFNTLQHAQHLTTEMLPNPGPINPNLNWADSNGYYASEQSVSNLSRARQGFDPNYHYQHTRNENGYNAYAAGPPGGRNNLAGRPWPGPESWSPGESPSRGREYLPDQYYRGNRDERAMGGAGNKRWRDYRQ
ncbi:Homeobox protein LUMINIDEPENDENS [Striga hermonthica]|uniref:Homeobox protein LUMINIDEPENDENS n=1 Tax=Striga hermonthica TaxID=68872 RepID=A0A9N7RID5_STRHE|nr:Homeobox protein LUMINIDEPENDENS [Striga hermonthica]